MRVLALVSDGFGGRGGIAQYNRHLLTALSSQPECEEVVALPRIVAQAEEPLPPRLSWIREGLGGKARYLVALLRVLIANRRFDYILCGHINLLPAAIMARWITGASLVLQVHGIDAWQPTRNPVTNHFASRVDLCIAVSRITRRRFLEWTTLAPHRCRVLPNTLSDGAFGPAPRSEQLLERYGLRGKRVMMTLGRMSAAEGYKGFDVVLDVLPKLRTEFPDLVYLIAGDGSDRQRLEHKVGKLGLSAQAVFTGLVDEGEKADHYRLADLYVMPSDGEGFGIVLLEALACGLPVIASSVDGGRDALRDGAYGQLVDPGDLEDLVAAIHKALSTAPVRYRPVAFSYANFHDAVGRIYTAPQSARA